MLENKEIHISEDEAALYDRQIRLWGLDAQKRLRGSRILVIGMRGLGAEICKNVVLAGVKSVTLMDHTNVEKDDETSQFLVQRTDEGKNRAECSLDRTQQLNPMVHVYKDTESVAAKPDEFFHNFEVVCATCCTTQEMIRINNVCHSRGIKFFAGDVFGYYGYMFADLNDHEYLEEVHHVVSTGYGAKKQKIPDSKMAKRNSRFITLQDVLDFDWASTKGKMLMNKTPETYFISLVLLRFRSEQVLHNAQLTKEEKQKKVLGLKNTVMEEIGISDSIVSDKFVSYCMGELSPVCAILGGVLSQEIIKAVSAKDMPHNNFFFFDGVDGKGLVDCIGTYE